MAEQQANTDIPWWQSGVVYQIYPRSFMDSNGDGIGDLAGVEQRLDHLVDLGVDALWLSPFYTSPMKDFGYDVADYCDVDPMFGSLDDARSLITSAHSKGLRVIVDFVPNHSSDQHPWFIESRSSRTNPKRDWYFWRDGPGRSVDGQTPPNNWLSHFGGIAWTWDTATEQWYLHSFLKEQPDLNWRNPEVRLAMMDVIRFWLDQGVDGFRLDVAHYIAKDPQLRDNRWLAEGERNPGHRDSGEFSRMVHANTHSHVDIHEWYAELRQVMDTHHVVDRGVTPRYSVGEIHLFDWDEWAKFYGTGPGTSLTMPFNFSLMKTGWNAPAIRAAIESCEASVPTWGWPNWVLGNHDESRVATRFGGEAPARAAMVLLLMLRGTPTLYYGDELGLVDTPISADQMQDPWGINVQGLGLGRDPERTPMPWDSTANAGFSPAGVSPWLPIGDPTVNVEAQRHDEGSFFSLTRSLLTLRRSRAALAVGSWSPIDAQDDSVVAFERHAPQEPTIVVAVRVGGAAGATSLGEGLGTVLLRSSSAHTGDTVGLESVELGANSAVVIERR